MLLLLQIAQQVKFVLFQPGNEKSTEFVETVANQNIHQAADIDFYNHHTS